jgi:glyceraldehyde 3-phosphate dehydrogenase
VRVPVSNVSAIDCNFILEKKTSHEELHELFDTCSRSNLKGILSINDDQKVSVDFNSDLSSCVVDRTLTYVVNSGLCRIFAWYNNELAYARRLFDLVEFISRNGQKS